ncbi:MAG: Mur ligase domain-containing protein, partial [Pseudomonadota bacterium]
MLLSALLADCRAADALRVIGATDIEIAGIAVDSRKVRPGELFAALDGTRYDGARFVPDALAQGAAALLGKPALANDDWPVPLVLDDNPRRRLAWLAARYFGGQPETVVAVTGTNGKTSIAHYTRALWQALGSRSASLGTLGLEGDGLPPAAGLT